MTLPIISRVNFGSSLLIEIEVRGASRGHRPYWMVTRNAAIRSILDIVQFSGQSHCQCLIWLHCRHGLHSPYLGTVSNGLACGVCMAVAWRVGAAFPVCRVARSWVCLFFSHSHFGPLFPPLHDPNWNKQSGH